MSAFNDQLRQWSGYVSLDDERSRAADEIERLQAIVDRLRTTEDGEYIIPNREYWTLHHDRPVPWLCRANAGYGDGRLFSSREAAEQARAGK